MMGMEGQAARSVVAPPEQQQLLDALTDLGVSERVAGDIIGRYPRAYLWRMVQQTRYARRRGLASHPAGWFVASVRGDWAAPAGYHEFDELEPNERRAARARSWGVCPRCSRRPCHCADETPDEVNGEAETI